MSHSLLAVLTFETPFIIIAVLVGICAFAVMYALANRKAAIDAEQEKLSKAAGGAQWLAGLTELADLLNKAASGNIKRTFRAAIALYDKYFRDERGPLRFAFDVFWKSWPHLRLDKEFGNAVIKRVVYTAFGWDENEQHKKVDFAKAGGRLDKIGWNKSAAAAYGLTADDFRAVSSNTVSLCEEVLEEDGEKKLAMRVAKPTIDAVFNDPKFHDQIMPILREYVAKDDARIAADDAKALEKAKATIAKENAAKAAGTAA